MAIDYKKIMQNAKSRDKETAETLKKGGMEGASGFSTGGKFQTTRQEGTVSAEKMKGRTLDEVADHGPDTKQRMQFFQSLLDSKPATGFPVKMPEQSAQTFAPDSPTRLEDFYKGRREFGERAGNSIASQAALNINTMPQEKMDNTVRNTVLAKSAKEQKLSEANRKASGSLHRLGPNIGGMAGQDEETKEFARSIQAPDKEFSIAQEGNIGTGYNPMAGMPGFEKIPATYGSESLPEVKISLPNHARLVPKDVEAADKYFTLMDGKKYVNRDKNVPYKITTTDQLALKLIESDPQSPDGIISNIDAGYNEGLIVFADGGLADLGNQMANSVKDEWNDPKSEIKRQYDKLEYIRNNSIAGKSRDLIDATTNPIAKFFYEGTSGVAQQASMYMEAVDEVATGAIAGAVGGPGGIALGAKTGFTYSMFKMERGSAYIQYREAGMEDAAAKEMSTIAGAVNAAIEYAELNMLAKGFPMVVKGISKNLYNRIPSKVLRGAVSVGGAHATTTAAEITQEGIQDFVTNIMQNRGFDKSNQQLGYDKYEIMPPKQLAADMWQEMKDVTPTMAMMSFLGLPANFNNFRSSEFNLKVSQKAVEVIDAIDVLQGNPNMKAENVEEYQKHIDVLVGYSTFVEDSLTNDFLSESNLQSIVNVMEMSDAMLTKHNEDDVINVEQPAETINAEAATEGPQGTAEPISTASDTVAPIQEMPVAETPVANIVGGKKQGNNVSIHKSMEGAIPSLSEAKEKVGDIDYDIIKVNQKNGSTTFIEVDDFNGKAEPTIISETTVNRDGSIERIEPTDKIIIDKASYVQDSYDGFDVAEAKSREKEWRDAKKHGAYDPGQIESGAYFNERAGKIFKGPEKEETPEETDKVSHKNGENIKLYHGSQNKFDIANITTRKAQAGEGIFLTDSIDEAKGFGENVYPITITPQKIATDNEWNEAFDQLQGEHSDKLDRLETKLEEGAITDSQYDSEYKRLSKEWSMDETTDLEQNAKVSKRLAEQGYDVHVGQLQSGNDGMEYMVLDKNIIKQETTEATPKEEAKAAPEEVKAETKAEKPEGNVGVHFGDLGKTEHLMQSGGSRSTGHYGTGTYFTADTETIERMSSSHAYSKRPKHEVSFDGHNLYVPKNAKQGRELHDFLWQVNKWAYDSEKYRDGISDMYINGSNLFDNAFTSETEMEDYLMELREYVEENREKDEKAYFDKSERYDSPSTKLMKYLGYEGVDVRGIKELDNEEFGSVIYDLKKDVKEDSKPATETKAEEKKPEETKGPQIIDMIKQGGPYKNFLYRADIKDKSKLYNPETGTGDKPILGAGEYYAFKEKDLEQYGGEISKEYVSIEMAYAIRNDNDWRLLAQEAGWKYPKFDGYDSKKKIELIDQMHNYLTDTGFDGVVVEFDGANIGETSILEQLFGISQVVKLKEEEKKADPVEAKKEETKAEPEAEKPLEEKVETETDLEMEKLIEKFASRNIVPIELAKAKKPTEKSVLPKTSRKVKGELNGIDAIGSEYWLVEKEHASEKLIDSMVPPFAREGFEMSSTHSPIEGYRALATFGSGKTEGVILINDTSKNTIFINRTYYEYFTRKGFDIVPNDNNPTLPLSLVKDGSQVGILLPIRVSMDYKGVDVYVEKLLEQERVGKQLDTSTEKVDNEITDKNESVGEKDVQTIRDEIQGVDERLPGRTEPEVLQGTETEGGIGNLSEEDGRVGVGAAPENEIGENGNAPQVSRVESERPGKTASDTTSGDASRGSDKRDVRATSEGYRITDTDIGKGGKVQRFNQNIAAIRLLKTLEQENRNATAEEMEVLAQFSGWGGIKEAFIDNNDNAWKKRAEEIKEILTEEQYRAAVSSTGNAFYTPIEVVDSMYDIVKALGVSEYSSILEPGCGVGNFLGRMPGKMNKGSRVIGVELDDITGNIAKRLYPNADIRVQGFQNVDVVKNSLDLVIGNVPFDETAPYDKNYKQYKGLTLHDYFILKGIDSLKPGGIMVAITSSGTMDKLDVRARTLMASKANLVAAIRMPSGTFDNTAVVSDIVIFQKKGDSVKDIGQNFTFTKNSDINNVKVNQYFEKNPEMILGKLVATTDQYGKDALTVKKSGKTIADIMDLIPKNIVQSVAEASAQGAVDGAIDVIIKEGKVETKDPVFMLDGENIYKKNAETGEMEKWHKIVGSGPREGEIEYFKPTSVGARRVRDVLDLYDDFQNLIHLESTTKEEGPLKVARQKFNDKYDAFVKKNKAVSHSSNKNVMNDDPRYWHLTSIEQNDYVDGEVSYVKHGALLGRVIPINEPITSVKNVSDALTVSLNVMGGVNLDYMAQLYNKDVNTVTDELGDRIYELPSEEGSFVLAEEYLSGNVKDKLKEAKELAAKNHRFERNVTALEKVQPDPLEADQIAVELGSPWIGTKTVEEFIRHLYNDDVHEAKVVYDRYKSTWKFRVSAPRATEETVHTRWGSTGITAVELIDAISNVRPIVVRAKDSNGKSYVHKGHTEMALGKATEIREQFNDWIYKDIDRRTRLVDFYNENYNNLVTREHNGDHLKMYGMNPEIKLNKHQGNAVSRTLQPGNIMYVHPVGSGKTYTMIGSVMEMKRLGIAKKPIMVVPNQKINDFMADFYKMYPGANILTIKDNDFSSTNRKKLLAKIQNTDFDCVIMRHSSFAMFPVSPAYQEGYIQKQINELEEVIRASKENNMGARDITALNKALASLEAELESLTDITVEDTDVFLDTCGIDALIVDEAHNYKNLAFPTKMGRIAGVQNSKAKKATHMHMATEYMNSMGNKVVFATATPISNSIGELYNMMRYLQPDTLKEYGINSFDSWAATFGKVVSEPEMNTTGSGLTTKERFSKFSNVPELIKMFKIVADIVRKDQLTLKLPKADIQHATAESSDTLAKYNEHLEEHKSTMSYEESKKGGHLLVMQDARHASLDLRCVRNLMVDKGVISPMTDAIDLDLPGSKINKAVTNILKEYKESTGILNNKGEVIDGTQIVFLDRGTPQKRTQKELKEISALKEKDPDELTEAQIAKINDFDNGKRYGFDLYADIKNKLVEQGIPENEIEFIQDNNTDAKKSALFDKVNAGQVRVLLGSTAIMGEGMNVQKQVVALHQLDAPLRPSDVEQRDGRALRQGNENDNIRLYHYSTLNSYDAPTWQMLSRKSQAVDQMFAGDESLREVEDVGEDVFANMSVEAANNPLMFERKDVEDKLARLRIKKKNFQRTRNLNQDTVANWPEKREGLENKAKELKALKAIADKNAKEFVVNGKKFETMKDASIALMEAVAKNDAKDESDRARASIRGVNVVIRKRLDGSYKADFKDSNAFYGAEANSKKDEFDKYVAKSNPETVFLRLDNSLESIPTMIKRLEESIADGDKALASAKKEVNMEFTQEAELVDMTNQLARIDEQLRVGNKPQAEESHDNNDNNDNNEDDDYVMRNVALETGVEFEPSKKLIGSFYEPKTGVAKKEIKVNIAKGDPKSINDIANIIRKEFKIGVTSKRFRKRKALGYFDPRTGNIGTKFASTIGVLSHELGHHLDQKYDIRKKHGAALQEMAKNLPENVRAAYKKEEYPGEALADFVQYYLTFPQEAYEFGELENGKNFYNMFEEMLSEKDRMALERARSEFMNYIGSDTNSKFKASIKSYNEIGDISLRDAQLDAYMKLVDKYEPLNRLMRDIREHSGKNVSGVIDAYRMALRSDRAGAIAHSITMNELRDSKGEVIGESFKAILRSLPRKQMKDFESYLKHVHTLDRLAQGKLTVSKDMNAAEIEASIATLEAKYPHFKETANKLYEWWDTFSRAWLVDTGMMAEEDYNRMREMYPHYVPMFRVPDKIGKLGGSGNSAKKGFSNQTNPIRKNSKDGSDIDTYSPIESMIMEIDRYVKVVSKRNVMLSLHELYNNDDYAGAFSGIMQKAGPDMKKSVVDTRDIKTKADNAIIDRKIEQLTDEERAVYENLDKKRKAAFRESLSERDAFDSAIEDAIQTFTPQKTSEDKAFVTVIHKDKSYFYEVLDIHMLKSLENLTDKQLGFFLKVLSEVKRMMVMMTTGANPIFGVTSNVWRDVPESFVLGNYNNPALYVKDLMLALVDVIKKSDSYLEQKAMGGGYESLAGANKKYLPSSVRALGTKDYKGVAGAGRLAVDTGAKFIDLIADFNDILESAPRQVIYNKTKKDTTKRLKREAVEGMSDNVKQIYDNLLPADKLDFLELLYEDQQIDYQARLDASYEYNDVTVNFGRSGSSKDMTAIIPFFTAGVQGLDKMYRAGFKDKGKKMERLLKGLSVITILSMIEYFINYDDDDWRNMPNYLRDYYWMIPTGNGKFIKLPKPRELGFLFSTLPQRALNEILHSEEDNGKAIRDAFIQNFMPPLRPVFAPLWDVARNESWSGSPIVSMRYMNTPKDQQYDDTTSNLSVGIVEALYAGGVKVSPIELDYMIKSFTGGLGQVVLPAVTPAYGAAGTLSGLKRKLTADIAYSSKVTNEFYNIRADLDEASERVKKKMRDSGYMAPGERISVEDTERYLSENPKDRPKNLNEEQRLAFNKTNKELSERWKAMSATNNNKTLSYEEKQEKNRAIRLEINEICEKEVKNFEALTKSK